MTTQTSAPEPDRERAHHPQPVTFGVHDYVARDDRHRHSPCVTCGFRRAGRWHMLTDLTVDDFRVALAGLVEVDAYEAQIRSMADKS